MPEEEAKVYTIPLKLFCSKDSTRFMLTSPFNFGRYTYATDGRIIVRVPKIYGYDSPPTYMLSTARAARGLFDKFPKHGFITITTPKKKDVRRNSYKQRVVQIGASNFNMVFLLAMKRLPNLKVRPPRIVQDIMPFTFDGGIGKVMPTLAQSRYTIKLCRASVSDASNTKQKGNKPHGTPKEKGSCSHVPAGRKTAIPRRRKRTSDFRRPKLR